VSIDKKVTNVIDFPARPSGLGATVFQQAMQHFKSTVRPAVGVHAPVHTVSPVKPPPTKAPISTIASGIASTPPKRALPFTIGFHAKGSNPTGPTTKPTAGNGHAPFDLGPTHGDPAIVHRPTKFKKGDKDPVVNGLQQHLIAWGFATTK
jgi:hypothetical protein